MSGVSVDARTKVVTPIEATPVVLPLPGYKELRGAAYPPFQEQFDMQYWDGVNGTTTWKDEIQRIKGLYPKD